MHWWSTIFRGTIELGNLAAALGDADVISVGASLDLMARNRGGIPLVEMRAPEGSQFCE